jgi:hypothetical protein
VSENTYQGLVALDMPQATRAERLHEMIAIFVATYPPSGAHQNKSALWVSRHPAERRETTAAWFGAVKQFAHDNNKIGI